MAKYKLTDKAVDDLTQIWDYTFDKWTENQADKYYQMLLDNAHSCIYFRTLPTRLRNILYIINTLDI